jgi:hypothetical protein
MYRRTYDLDETEYDGLAAEYKARASESRWSLTPSGASRSSTLGTRQSRSRTSLRMRSAGVTRKSSPAQPAAIAVLTHGVQAVTK